MPIEKKEDRQKTNRKISAPLSKNAVSLFQITCNYFVLPLKISEEINRRRQYLSYQTFTYNLLPQ